MFVFYRRTVSGQASQIDLSMHEFSAKYCIVAAGVIHFVFRFLVLPAFFAFRHRICCSPQEGRSASPTSSRALATSYRPLPPPEAPVCNSSMYLSSFAKPTTTSNFYFPKGGEKAASSAVSACLSVLVRLERERSAYTSGGGGGGCGGSRCVSPEVKLYHLANACLYGASVLSEVGAYQNFDWLFSR